MTSLLNELWITNVEKPLIANLEFDHPKCIMCKCKITPCTEDNVPKVISKNNIYLNKYFMIKSECCKKIICSSCFDYSNNKCEYCEKVKNFSGIIFYINAKLTRPLLNLFKSGQDVTF